MVDECAAGTHDCDKNANCIDTDDGYICTCKKGFIDESPNQSQKPGRICRQRMCLISSLSNKLLKFPKFQAIIL